MWTAILGIFAAVIGFLGVIVGAVVTGIVTLRQTHLATAREREAQAIERQQQRKDAHDAFQRESILELQEAIEELWVLCVRDSQERRRRGDKDEDRPGTQARVPRPPPPGFGEAKRRVDRVCARIFDDQLRDLALAIQMELVPFVSWDASAPSDRLQAINQRVNVLLRDLY